MSIGKGGTLVAAVTEITHTNPTTCVQLYPWKHTVPSCFQLTTMPLLFSAEVLPILYEIFSTYQPKTWWSSISIGASGIDKLIRYLS